MIGGIIVKVWLGGGLVGWLGERFSDVGCLGGGCARMEWLGGGSSEVGFEEHEDACWQRGPSKFEGQEHLCEVGSNIKPCNNMVTTW